MRSPNSHRDCDPGGGGLRIAQARRAAEPERAADLRSSGGISCFADCGTVLAEVHFAVSRNDPKSLDYWVASIGSLTRNVQASLNAMLGDCSKPEYLITS